ncbi:hypothetical protein PHO31112_02808 [Pandoraea horticolens]|uniref:Exo-alpha-sialidase n=1 Tax=Pandoraea horticolens TaxID=2508298 RepID=A0A5E4VQM1_9BURK|nr:hypothetical protein [Pandoraea horticolens]VVE14642.1 hypothetical protein PHO31112_02808 [Pandoraea horticolens]
MGKKNMIRKPIVPGDIYVFFQKSDSPTHPSYIRLDLNTGMWSVPFTLPSMSLHDQENGVYNSDPRAAYYKGKLYLFGRAPDNSIQVMTSADGQYWSDPVTLGTSKTCSAVMPYVFNDSLYVFYPGIDGGNPICCNKYDENLNQLNWWVAPQPASTIYPVGFSLDQQIVFFNSNGVLSMVDFNDNGFSGAGGSIGGYNLSLWPSTLDANTANALVVINFFRGTGTDSRLYQDDDGNVIDGINIYTAPSTALLESETAQERIVAVFYAENNPTRNLRCAVTKGLYFNVLSKQDTGISLAPNNCSPFAILIPQ